MSDQNPILSEPLPRLYEKWLREGAYGDIPRESKADCANCPLCRGTESLDTYRPDTKCCTYFPDLPNFLVGAILVDPDTHPQVLHSISDRIDDQSCASPLGITRPPLYALTYDAVKDRCFGRVPSFLCPYYVSEEGGLCGIWQHRNSSCATWFCKHVAGSRGQRFWRELEVLLKRIEDTLSLWACSELGLSDTCIKQLTKLRALSPSERVARELLNVGMDSNDVLWEKWDSERCEFYIAANKTVSELPWSAVLRVGGPDLERLARTAADALNSLKRRTPLADARLGTFTVGSKSVRGFMLVTHSRTDAVAITSEQLSILCNGPPHDLLNYLKGHGFGDALVGELFNHGILISDDEPQICEPFNR